MATYLSNAFSLGMLPNGGLVNIVELEDKYVKSILQDGFVSAVGHQSTADFIKLITGIDVPVNRVAITLQPDDKVIVLQLQGRLPEGKVLTQEEIQTIPYKWFVVEVLNPFADYLAI
jgi:hypothetical protein